jgi:hypothetical protein
VRSRRGTAELLDRERRVPRVEQDRVHVRRDLDGLADRGLAHHVDHLHERHAGQRVANLRVGVRFDRVAELEGVRAAPSLLGDDRVRVLKARQQERRDRRRRVGGDLADELLFDRPGPGWHRRDEADRGRPCIDRHAGFVDARDAADLDPRHGHELMRLS